MHRLTSSFILGYHGCDRKIGEKLLQGGVFKPSNNEYDWLGPGVYFWESNPQRGMDFAVEASKRAGSNIKEPFVIGAVIDLGFCLDLTTSAGIEQVRIAYESLKEVADAGKLQLPKNNSDRLRRNLDCAVIRRLHEICEVRKLPSIDTLKGVFIEGKPIYPNSEFNDKTHIQIAVRNLECIKGVFRVPSHQIS